MIASTQLSDIIKRDAATPNVQKSVFIQANLPLTSPKPRLPLPFQSMDTATKFRSSRTMECNLSGVALCS